LQNPVAKLWYQDDQPGGGNPHCKDGTGCSYYSLKSNDNFFLMGLVMVKALKEATILVFDNQPSLGFVCGSVDAVVNDQKSLLGYCCLGAPYYQSDP
jgi:hypothetical protein